MNHRIRVLTIGHSYVVAENRALVREVARDPQLDVTVAAPIAFRSGLGPIELQPEPPGSNLVLKALAARFTQWTQIFAYDRHGLAMLIGKGAFDVVHAWEEPYIYAGYQIARAMAKSDAAFCFRTAQNIDKRYPFPFSYFERAVRERAQGWIAGGNLVFESMIKHGYPKERGRIMTLAVDLDAFRPLAPERKQTVARELGLLPPIVAYVGRLTRAKGIDLMMRAMEAVGGSAPWSLLVMGAGPMEGNLRQWAASRGWSDRVQVRLVPHRDVPAYLGAADLLLAPSQTGPRWREQFGRMVIEAFACGVPVLGSDSGEIPYIIEDAGKVLPENDADSWAKAIVEVLNSAELRAGMARRGFERVQAYSVTTVAQQYSAYYRDLAAPCRLIRRQKSSMPKESLEHCLQTGRYSRKQLFSRNRILQWSHRNRYAMARRMVHPYAGGNLLDYGCGDGTFLAMVHDLFPRATGAEIDRSRVEDCQTRFHDFPAISFALTSDLARPEHDGAYDVVLCTDVLEHCLDHAVEDALDDLCRTVSPTGTVIISVPVEIGPPLAFKQLIRSIAAWQRLGDYEYREKYSFPEFRKMLMANERTQLERPIYSSSVAPNVDIKFHGHKGFNWRILESKIHRRFEVREIHFSPIDGAGKWFASQVWFICSPLSSMLIAK